ncbi:MAG: GldG family protein [Clostridiales bacterium]|nr:GldG family protein [Bacillota bacterium]NLK03020.1 GldG family protein [Clostridiales bacterium]
MSDMNRKKDINNDIKEFSEPEIDVLNDIDKHIDDNNDDKHVNKEGVFYSIKESLSRRNFRSAAYVSLISAVVIGLVILVNLIITEFDLKIDLSKQGFYTLSEETKEYIKKIEDDVTIYYLIEAGNETPMFHKIGQKFDSISDRISLVQKDPIQYPNFASEYVDDEIGLNSFLVVNNRTNRAKYVDNSEMLVKEFNQQTFQYNTIGVDIEGKLLSAIQYVTNPDLPVIYYTVGHEEYEIGSLFKDTFDRINITTSPLQTLTLDQIPEDCDVLVINCPSIDFSDSEKEMIKDYMAAGGNAVIVMDYRAQDFRNLNSLINYYGIQMEKGYICEGDSNNHVPLYPHYIVPNILNHKMTGGLSTSNRLVVTPVASGLTIMDNVRSSLSIEPLIETTDKAYSKLDINSTTLLKEEGDIDGPFYVGVLATDTYNGITSNMVIYTSSMIFDDSMLSEFGNHILLVNTIGNLVGEIEYISVRPRYLFPEPLNITQKSLTYWSALTIIVLPILVLSTGIVIVVRRRKR